MSEYQAGENVASAANKSSWLCQCITIFSSLSAGLVIGGGLVVLKYEVLTPCESTSSATQVDTPEPPTSVTPDLCDGFQCENNATCSVPNDAPFCNCVGNFAGKYSRIENFAKII